jgi:class 3 adenylate cyclase
MAVAMQQRLIELGRVWRSRGIESPFLARIGINTGYCNVGNFGSADRMDYTIIGAEANLAARLESIAEPGGIVMSYETYALVREKIRARAMQPITLKGISREVVPYAVDPAQIAGGRREGDVYEESSDSLRLYVNLSELDAREAEKIEAALAAAQKAVRARSAEKK